MACEVFLGVLRWHADQLPDGPMQDSDLLFPSLTGGLRSESVLQKPFAQVCNTIKLGKRLTPRGMRRTFQDLARAAEVKDIVTRAISGHLTEEMQQHYSTVGAKEIEEAIGKVVSLAKFRDAMTGKVVLPEQDQASGGGGHAEEQSGMHCGMHGPKKKKSVSRG